MGRQRYRKPPFAMVSETWIARLHEDGSISTRGAVFLLLAARASFDDRDRCITWRSRDEMAATLGVSASAVSNAVGRLTADGDISVVWAGRKGRATTYQLMRDTPWTSAKVPPHDGTFKEPYGTTVSTPKVPPHDGTPHKEEKGPGSLDATPPPSVGAWGRLREEVSQG